MSHRIHLPTPEGRIAVAFAFRIDRFCHRVDWVSEKTVLPLLSSAEGDDQQPWPTSPPIQQLDQLQERDRVVLLGLGMAGQSHWSISVSVDGASSRLVWDVACRIQGTPDWLGSTYRLWCAVDQEQDDTLAFALPDATCRLCAADSPPGRCCMERQAEWVMLIPDEPPQASRFVATYRWRYYLQVE
ncbi:MAG: hypothetical protein KatS3mg110_4223 [Pirellulaceae bacterium]|nr:MAG: hypothetical protein KatS3mg110_4223 [Pirellulaceae bacterium]